MSILDGFDKLSEQLDKSTENYFFSKIYFYKETHPIKANDVKNQIGYDGFNNPIRPGDWILYNAAGYGGCKLSLARVIKITTINITIEHPVIIYNWEDKKGYLATDENTKNIKFNTYKVSHDGIKYETRSISRANVVKIIDKEKLIKEFNIN